MKTQLDDKTIIRAPFERPVEGSLVESRRVADRLELSGVAGWQSNGGPTRGHPCRSLPFSLEVEIPKHESDLLRIYLAGVFALYAERDTEALGTLGASVQLISSDRDIAARFDLINGRHYSDARDLSRMGRVIGDGTSVENVGQCQVRGEEYRLDLLSLDIPVGLRAGSLLFKDLGSPASFVIFDVFCEFESSERSQVKKEGTHQTLGELGAAIRVGDRARFARSLQQLDLTIEEAENLDEARAGSLDYLAVVIAALNESTAGKPEPGVLLAAAREIDRLNNRSEIGACVRRHLMEAIRGYFVQSESPTDRLMDRALAIVERHYAKDLSDAMVAAQLGLSTSHFRYLFRQATGHPFHKYVVGFRLEKARQILIEEELPVSQVAAAVGFTGLSHFSRAFSQRFSASPSHFRRAAG